METHGHEIKRPINKPVCFSPAKFNSMIIIQNKGRVEFYQFVGLPVEFYQVREEQDSWVRRGMMALLRR